MTHWHLLHAVHRRSETLQKAIASWHIAGIERVVMHPDNGTLGPMHNLHRAMKAAIQESRPGDHICVLQDDMVLCRDALLRIEAGRKTETLVLFTPKQNVENGYRCGNGWVPLDPSWNTWGGMVLMPRETAELVVGHFFWKRHILTMTERRLTDAATFATLGLLGAPCWQHVPSLSDHIGHDSTIGNEHSQDTQGYRFCEWEQAP